MKSKGKLLAAVGAVAMAFAIAFFTGLAQKLVGLVEMWFQPGPQLQYVTSQMVMEYSSPLGDSFDSTPHQVKIGGESRKRAVIALPPGDGLDSYVLLSAPEGASTFRGKVALAECGNEWGSARVWVTAGNSTDKQCFFDLRPPKTTRGCEVSLPAGTHVVKLFSNAFANGVHCDHVYWFDAGFVANEGS